MGLPLRMFLANGFDELAARRSALHEASDSELEAELARRGIPTLRTADEDLVRSELDLRTWRACAAAETGCRS